MLGPRRVRSTTPVLGEARPHHAPDALVVTLSRAELRSLVAEAVADALAELAPPKDEPLTLSGVEMARRLGISRSAMHRLRVDHGCPAVRVGDFYRYRPAAVVAWLESRESGSHMSTCSVAAMNDEAGTSSPMK